MLYFCTERNLSKCKFLRLWVLGSKFTKFLLFLKQQIVFSSILYLSLVSWDVNPLYLFIWNFLYFQQKQPIIVQLWWNFVWAVESLKLCTLLGSFCKNHKKFQLKKLGRVISWHWRVMKICKNWHINLVNFHPTTQKSKNFTSMSYFCQNHMRFELKNCRGVIFHDTEQWWKFE